MIDRTSTSPALCFSSMAGVFPGAASVDELWQRILRAEIAPLTPMSSRWAIDESAIVSAEPGAANRIYLDRGHCLPADAGAAHDAWGRQWSIAWSVLARLVAQATAAGRFDREDVALVLGTSWSDESYFMADALGQPPSGKPWFDPGDQTDELSRALGLGGPAIAVDTACSSFAYALDAARVLIRTGQARAAVVAGVNAFLPPAIFLGFAQLRALAPGGALIAFGAEASGIVPGECVAAFLVESTEDAARGGRRPLGLLGGLGLSSDGAEGSVFAPGLEGQLAAYARAYGAVGPDSIDYVEGHGTGTALGDATELDSLDRFFRPHRAPGQRMAVGSIKALIGHPLAAAGAAALAKVLLMLRHRTLPPHIAVAPSPRLEASCLGLVEAPRALAPRDRPMRVGLSSFGFGGANAHLVVEEAVEATAPRTRRAAPAEGVELAVVALDACFAGAIDSTPDSTSVDPTSVDSMRGRAAPVAMRFPIDRFCAPAGSAAGPSGSPLEGHFLRGAHTIDIAGYRLGPRPLRHVDPFKLLVSHRVSTMLRRLPAAARSAETAIVMCANMGGERFFDAYRKIVGFYAGRGSPPDIAVEDVATMMPTMLSGYPASFLDLRGFHETLSGGAGIFFAALAGAAAWLGERCRTLVLGAGRYLSCPADVCGAADAGGRPGEGIGLVALKTVAGARRDGDRVLGILRCGPRGGQARSLEEARRAAGARAGGEQLEICELVGSGAELGRMQMATGFLREATGVESILGAVLGPPRRTAIEVRRAGRPVGWWFVETEDAVGLPADGPPAIPFTIEFSRPQPAALAPATPAASQAASQAPAEEPEPEPEPNHVPSDSLLGLEAYAEIGRTVAASLGARARALELLLAGERVGDAQPDPLGRRLHALRADPQNVVIAAPRRAGSAVRAALVVHEQHPYFFDHPLDHVPGILLLEGVLQLVELAAADPDGFVSAIHVRFRRYTEKGPPIEIEAGPGGEPGRWLTTVEQSGQRVCECEVSASRVPATAPPAQSVVEAGSPPRRALLHKSRDENVLVGAPEEHAGSLRMRTLPIPPGHFFADGHPHRLSMLYFLEIARQGLMLAAHTRLGVPLGVPMSLLSLEFDLSAPIPRAAPLLLVPELKAEPWNGLLQTARVGMTLHHASGPGEPLGAAIIVAQVIDGSLYARQRHSAGHVAG